MVKTTLLLLLVAATASADPVRHVPPASALADSQIELVAEAPSSTPTLVAHERPGRLGERRAVSNRSTDGGVPAAPVGGLRLARW